jgi:hypothetical protein
MRGDSVPPNVQQLLLNFDPQSISFILRNDQSHNEILGLFTSLCDTQTLRSLQMDVIDTQMGDTLTEHTSALIGLQNMTRLSFDFHRNEITANGLKYLGNSISQCNTLTYLRLDLSFNSMCADGLSYLTQFKILKQLTVLRLMMFACGIADEGAAALSNLWECPSLVNLELNLIRNAVTNTGVAYFTQFHQNTTLQTFELQLYENNMITDAGAQALSQLHQTPALTELVIGFPGRISDAVKKNLQCSLPDLHCTVR